MLLDVSVYCAIVPPSNLTARSASDDLEEPDRLRSLLKDLREARQAKSREGLRVLDNNALQARHMLD